MPSNHGDHGWGWAAVTAAATTAWFAVMTLGLLAYCHRYGG